MQIPALRGSASRQAVRWLYLRGQGGRGGGLQTSQTIIFAVGPALSMYAGCYTSLSSSQRAGCLGVGPHCMSVPSHLCAQSDAQLVLFKAMHSSVCGWQSPPSSQRDLYQGWLPRGGHGIACQYELRPWALAHALLHGHKAAVGVTCVQIVVTVQLPKGRLPRSGHKIAEEEVDGVLLVSISVGVGVCRGQ